MSSSRSHDSGTKPCNEERFEGGVSRCGGVLIKGGVPALKDAASPWVPDSVRFALLVIAAHLPFSSRGVELSGVLDVQEGFGSDDGKVREVDFPAVKRL